MQHAQFDTGEIHLATLCDLRLAEARFVMLLRLWHAEEDGQARALDGLSTVLGAVRGRACLSALGDMLALLGRHGWHAPQLLAETAGQLSQDEAALARFVMLASEQERDQACLEASFLVHPEAILPLVLAASRVGLPLLCEESRCRLHAAMRPH